MRAFVALILVILVAAPAGAGEPSGAVEVTPLADLIAEIETEIAIYQTAADLGSQVMPLPGRDLDARIRARMLHADYFIGSIRARAHDTLHAWMEGVVLDAFHHVGSDDDELSAITALEDAGATPLQVWQVNVFMAEWLRLQDDIARLRVLVEPGLPARVCPVEGFTWFRDEWASARPWARIHKGVDMNTEFGQVLVAVEDGVVIQANWHRLGGRQVWFRGDSTGDVYYYAHLEYWPRWLWSGSRLEAGDYLGLAGTSGNADSPHLHFGWMPGSNDVDLDNLQNPYYLVYELCH